MKHILAFILGAILGIALLFEMNALVIYHPTEISGFHWRCNLMECNLYSPKGENVATITSNFGSGFQAYSLSEKNLFEKSFETQQEAFEFVAREIEAMRGSRAPGGAVQLKLK